MSVFHVAGASRLGPQHAACEDRFGVFECGSRLVLCVADGAGSASRAAVGAELVVDAVASSLLTVPADAQLELLAQTAVRAAIDAVGGDRSLAATCSVVVSDGFSAAAAMVGDSPVFVRQDGVWRMWLPSSTSEFVNETVFVSSAGVAPAVFGLVEGVDAFAVGSDGVLPLAVSASCPVAGFFEPLLSRLVQGALDMDAFLEFAERRLGMLADDTTLLLAAPR